MSYQDRDYYRPTGGFTFMPPVIKNLLIINAIVFFISVIGESISVGNMTMARWINEYFGLIPLNYPYGSFYPWQLVTYQFIHGGFGHIFFNMLMLWMFGMELENFWGSKKFLLFYIISGLGAGLLQLFLSPVFDGVTGPTIGASGAVFGIMLAFAFYFPDRYIFIYFLFPVKAKYLIAFLMVIEFLSVGDQSFTAHLAHIGGASTALILLLSERYTSFRLDSIFDLFKGRKKSNYFESEKPRFRKSSIFDRKEENIEDATFFDIDSSSKRKEVTQEEIDRILDKISQSGYQKLTEDEKRILFEASKKN